MSSGLPCLPYSDRFNKSPYPNRLSHAPWPNRESVFSVIISQSIIPPYPFSSSFCAGITRLARSIASTASSRSSWNDSIGWAGQRAKIKDMWRWRRLAVSKELQTKDLRVNDRTQLLETHAPHSRDQRLKITYCRQQRSKINFQDDARELFIKFNEVFSHMPIACLIGERLGIKDQIYVVVAVFIWHLTTSLDEIASRAANCWHSKLQRWVYCSGQSILCMHGGISPLLNSLDDIRNVSVLEINF